jgi:ribosome-binding factor A
MATDKRTRRRLRAHCGELNEDDAVDPRDFFAPPKTRSGGDRKTLQLCSQVAETLAFVFAGELEDEMLQELRVEAVVPAPNSSQLAVTLRAAEALDDALAEEIRRRLDRASGRLRCEVAAAITRRRAPRLVFHVIGPARGE